MKTPGAATLKQLKAGFGQPECRGRKNHSENAEKIKICFDLLRRLRNLCDLGD